MPRLTGTRSPRLLARPRLRPLLLLRVAAVPPLLLETLALPARAAAFRAATLLRPTGPLGGSGGARRAVPLAVSCAARWKRLTAGTVEAPNWPSTLTEKPALRRAF